MLFPGNYSRYYSAARYESRTISLAHRACGHFSADLWLYLGNRIARICPDVHLRNDHNGISGCRSVFIKFWTRGRDPLFIIFSLAFWLLAASQILLAILGTPREEQGWAYILRLLAFALIIVAIIHKNISRRIDR